MDWSLSEGDIASVSEWGVVRALAAGTVKVYATSLSGGKRDSCMVEVSESMDLTLADFDELVPVTETVDPHLPQLYFPGGSGDVEAENPLVNVANPSGKVFHWMRSAGNWQLFGIHKDTLDYPDLGAYSQLQFKYYGKDLQNFYIQLKTLEGGQYEVTVPVEGKDCWQLFTMDLGMEGKLKQFNVFANTNFGSPAFEAYFDDFKLAAEAAVPYDGLSLSEEHLDLASGEEHSLVAQAEGHPLSWISTFPQVASVDQLGRVLAVGKGTAHVYAVPLFGDARMCEVKVDGGGDPLPPDYEQHMILDFENYELDWTSGYGAYSWASDQWSKTANPQVDPQNASASVLSWYRDGSNYGGGFGVGFPAVSTRGWERLSLLVYSDTPIAKIKLDPGDASPDPISTVEVEVDILPHQWTQVLVPLVDFDTIHLDMSKMHFLMALGTLDTLHVWVDNVWLERGGTVPLSGISIEGPPNDMLAEGQPFTAGLNITPSDASYPQVEWTSTDPSILSVDRDGQLVAHKVGEVVLHAHSKLYPHLKDSLRLEVVFTIDVPTKGVEILKVYPNPATSELVVEHPGGMLQASLYATSGRMVRQVPARGMTRMLLTGLDQLEGFYLLKVELKNGSFVYQKIRLE